jgi:GT2 family glycosyltransferase
MITRNRRESAMQAVERLRSLPERPAVVVVDNGSSDGTADALRAVGGVTVIDAGTNLGAAGRTRGVEAAQTPYVAFSDDDSWWAPGALARAADDFDAHPRLGLLTGRTVVGPDQLDDPINALLAAAPVGAAEDLPGPTVLGFLACAAVVRRAAYLDAGGFHPRYGVGGEEQLLALDLLAAGWGLAYVADVVVHHHPASVDRSGRVVRQARNDLWTTWLRRPVPVAAAATVDVARRAVRDSSSRAVLSGALRGLPWVVRERRPVPAAVEALRRRID